MRKVEICSLPLSSPLPFVVLFSLFLPTAVLSATYEVRPDGTGDFPTIQAAVNAAANGDVIELSDGTFTGPGNRDINMLGKVLTVASQGGDPAPCIIDFEGMRAFAIRTSIPRDRF